MKKWLILMFIAAIIVRLIGLNQSLWLDEATTAKVVRTFSYSGILQSFSPHDFHPPLYYMFMKAWTTLVGTSEIALRMPSVISAIITGYIVYLIGRKHTESTGLWAALFFLVNPLIWYYSQEARMYLIVTALLAGAVYYMHALITDKGSANRKNLILTYCILTGVSFAFFYGSVLFVATVFLYLVITRRYKLAFFTLAGMVISVLLLSPLLMTQMDHANDSLSLVPNWRSVLGTVTLKNLFLIPIKFTIGRIQFEPKKLYYALAGIMTVITMWYAVKGSRKYPHMGLWIVGTLAAGTIFSLFTPLLQYFRFLYLIPLVTLLLSEGARTIRDRVIMLSIFMLCTGVYIGNSAFHREDWKSLSALVPEKSAVYMIPYSADPLLYYRPDLVIEDLRTPTFKKGQDLIVVIPYTAEIYGLRYDELLKKSGYTLSHAKSVRGLQVEFWKK